MKAPQIIMALWLAATVVTASIAAWKLRRRHPKGWLVLWRVRITVYDWMIMLSVAVAAVSEGVTLWCGGFWHE